MKKSTITFISLILLFSLGLLWILVERFQSGDVYPPYSSLRSDPQGTKAFYKSLSKLNQYKVDRNFKEIRKWQPESPFTLFMLNQVPEKYFIKPESGKSPIEEVLKKIEQGNRLILAYNVTNTRAKIKETKDKKEEENSENKEKEVDQKNEDKENEEFDYQSIEELIGIEVFHHDFNSDKHYYLHKNTSLPQQQMSSLPSTIPWMGNLFFSTTHKDWHSLYFYQEEPVIAYRKYGKGEIIALGSSYPLSNEALYIQRETHLLQYLAGNPIHIYFDEYHLGLGEQLGVMALIRSYRLHGLIIGLLLTLLLAIWRLQKPLILAKENNQANPTMTHLGNRSIYQKFLPSDELISSSLAEWRRTLTPQQIKKISQNELEIPIQQFVISPENKKDKNSAVARYNQIVSLLKKYKL
jgi:hypothetical protein